ncbi:39S ribosomal protein L47, mitochondrial-like [Homarus americanus]|uniref:39S ribosomal protein L47-like n=1 Tax=Homarus americanus TaxID=6706 RepID=A0A8J5MWX6_HOMAM|nr:39S ribosomal protein L47, mitochondrial-like [Homarus americanus]KAG7166943.1 39S ribosomal protein L47-like [Homarus americanus]
MMAALRRPSSALTAALIKFSRLHITPRQINPSLLTPTTTNNYFKTLQRRAFIHTTGRVGALSEFFDGENNWGEAEVKVGRAWRLDELRIKSNEDLHKLWYVLLKEKNMLLTMEHAAKEEHQLFPNPERIDKVEESMTNLEEVVKERNRAYWLLETGETGERPSGMVVDPLGRRLRRKFVEHHIPVWMHHQSKENIHRGFAVKKFQRLMREKSFLEKRKYYRRVRNHVCMLMRRFPNMDLEKVQQQYPEVDVQALRKRKIARGHHSENQG